MRYGLLSRYLISWSLFNQNINIRIKQITKEAKDWYTKTLAITSLPLQLTTHSFTLRTSSSIPTACCSHGRPSKAKHKAKLAWRNAPSRLRLNQLPNYKYFWLCSTLSNLQGLLQRSCHYQLRPHFPLAVYPPYTACPANVPCLSRTGAGESVIEECGGLRVC